MGFAVGAVRRSLLLPKPDTMRPGDILLGLASSGLHSNGFSLVRKIIQQAGLTFSSPCPWQSGEGEPTPTVGEALLVPTTIYARQLRALLHAQAQPLVKGLAHITGGGLVENVPRVVPRALAAAIDARVWGGLPPVFRWLLRAGRVAPAEMARTFNCGIGMVLVVAPEHADAVVRLLAPDPDPAPAPAGTAHAPRAAVHRIGCLVESSGGSSTQLAGLETWADT